jgi:imidazolonepropionase-like amidohydrolase
MSRFASLLAVAILIAACGGEPEPAAPAEAPPPMPGLGAVAFTGATVWDGTGSAAQENVNLIVRDGRVESISTDVPAGAETVDVSGKFIVPGIINSHGHVSGYWADDAVTDPVERVREDLALYARYGVTSVLSLGGAPPEAKGVRDSQDTPALNRARLHYAGDVITGDTPEEASAMALANIEQGVDWIKIRVDDNLGTTPKMPWNAVQAAINAARAGDKPVATHIFYMDDAAQLLAMGTNLIAHSVRDRAVTDEFVQAMLDSGVCYVPTLVREVSTFVYAERPEWFDDPFFIEGAKRSEMQRLTRPEYMAEMAASPMAAGYRAALPQAQENLRIILGSGVPVAFGTDSGVPGRFPGYFEHMEFDLMTAAGLTSREILRSATSVAATCLGLDDVGTLEAGKWADFIVLDEDPIADIQAMRSIDAVYIAGNTVPR